MKFTTRLGREFVRICISRCWCVYALKNNIYIYIHRKKGIYIYIYVTFLLICLLICCVFTVKCVCIYIYTYIHTYITEKLKVTYSASQVMTQLPLARSRASRPQLSFESFLTGAFDRFIKGVLAIIAGSMIAEKPELELQHHATPLQKAKRFRIRRYICDTAHASSFLWWLKTGWRRTKAGPPPQPFTSWSRPPS